MPGHNRPAIEKSGTPGQTGTTGGCTGLNPISNRQKCQSGTPVHGKADPPSKKAGNRGQGPGVRERQGRRRKEEPTPFQTLIGNYLDSQPFSPKTKHGYRARLALLAAFLDPGGILTPREITKAHVAAYAASLEGRSDATRAAYLNTLKTFFAWLAAENLILTNPASHLRSPHPSTLAPLPLSENQMMRLLNSPDTETVFGLRDRAMLETLYATGMRSGELVALKLQDVDLAENLCFIQKGKGDRCRWVPLTEDAALFIRAYIEKARHRLAKGRACPFLFISLYGGRLSVVDLRNTVRSHARRAGIARKVHPHLLRHTAACHLLENGASLFHVQLLLGHARATTTQRYTAVSMGHLKEAFRCHPRA